MAPEQENLRRVLTFLTSTWGLLSSVSGIFPGAAYLLNQGLVRDSPLSAFYAATVAPLSALAVLLVVFFEWHLATPRRVKRRVVAVSFVCVLALVLFVSYKPDTTRKTVTKGSEYSDGYDLITKAGGYVTIQTYLNNGYLLRQSEYEDPDEGTALFWFNVAFISFAIAFTTITLHLDSVYRARGAVRGSDD